MAAEYDIWINNYKRLHEWISQQPNLISIDPSSQSGDRIYCQFNHTTLEEQKEFKKNVVARIFEIDTGNNTFETLLDQLEELQTDQLFYSVEFLPTAGLIKTNIGATYTNLFPDLAGRPFFIDTTGFTKLAVQILWTKVGTGTQTIRIIDDASGTQILESPSLITGSNDFANVNIPTEFLNFKGKWRLQAKSTVAADDPTFFGIRIYLRR
jgi:hypothetical protein